MALPFDPEIISTHTEYLRLLKAYQDAKEAYQLDDSKENWKALQEALLCLELNNKCAIQCICYLFEGLYCGLTKCPPL